MRTYGCSGTLRVLHHLATLFYHWFPLFFCQTLRYLCSSPENKKYPIIPIMYAIVCPASPRSDEGSTDQAGNINCYFIAGSLISESLKEYCDKL